MTGTLTPAYGRDYKSKTALLADWNANKDFDLRSFNSGGYVNRSQAEQAGATNFQVRWKKLTMVAIIKRGKDGTWK